MTDDIVLAHFVCTCGAVLMDVTKPAHQEPGPISITVPRSLMLVCRTCIQRQQDEIRTRMASERLRTWPVSNSVN